jgi:hypothetical protein
MATATDIIRTIMGVMDTITITRTITPTTIRTITLTIIHTTMAIIILTITITIDSATIDSATQSPSRRDGFKGGGDHLELHARTLSPHARGGSSKQPERAA